jgi:hypothetical protein
MCCWGVDAFALSSLRVAHHVAKTGLMSGRDRLWILTRLLLYMLRYSGRANGEADAGRYSSHSRLQGAVTSWPRRTNPMAEASWTLCIGGGEMQGHGEGACSSIPSEDRNRLSLLDWCACNGRATFRHPHVERSSGDRPTLLHASRAPVVPTSIHAALTGAPLRPCHAVTLYGDQQGSLNSIQAISSDYRPAAPGASARSKPMKWPFGGGYRALLTSKRVVRCLARRHSTTYFRL